MVADGQERASFSRSARAYDCGGSTLQQVLLRIPSSSDTFLFSGELQITAVADNADT